VEEATELAEGGTAQGVRDLIMRLNAELPALCTHGDVIEELLGGESEKGSTWVLVLADGAFRPVEYLPPAPSD
jgi:hypothetical protein